MRESLENVKVGDVVIEHCRWENVIATVMKVTATQIVIGRGDRYRKKDGYMVGGSGGVNILDVAKSYAVIQKPELIKELK